MESPLNLPENKAKCIWIFGYGSLVHTPNFAYSQRLTGYIKGYRRVFWQGSTDHRGTPQRPGRTVTLAADPDPSTTTWGAVFQLAGTPEEQAATLSYLEWREKEYDVRQLVNVYDGDGEIVVQDALVYIASPTNSNYLGPADLHEIAVQIATSRGPSGPNWEYLFKLAQAMRGMEVPDPDLYGLEDLVRQHLALLPSGDLAVDASACSSSVSLVTTVSTLAVASCSSVPAQGKAGEEEGQKGEDSRAGNVPDWEHDFRRWHKTGVLRQQPAGAAAIAPELAPGPGVGAGTGPAQEQQGVRTGAGNSEEGMEAGEQRLYHSPHTRGTEDAGGGEQDSSVDGGGVLVGCQQRWSAGEHVRAVYAVEAMCTRVGSSGDEPG